VLKKRNKGKKKKEKKRFFLCVKRCFTLLGAGEAVGVEPDAAELFSGQQVDHEVGGRVEAHLGSML
jgi:hypothetical protein